MSEQNQYVTVEGNAYHAGSVAAFKTFDAFKEDALAQNKANKEAPTLHFCHWGEQQLDKLKEVWDKAVALVKPVATAQKPTETK